MGGRPSRARSGSRAILPASRAIFIRETEWKRGTRLPALERTALLRCLRARDVCLLATLVHHHYLTTDQVASLFFPSLRAAQMRLRWLGEKRHLLMRWRQIEPAAFGWRRRHSLHMLTDRGAAIASAYLKLDPRSIIKRSFAAAEYSVPLAHDLEVIAFFVGLAAASRVLPDQGLYQWIGAESMRRAYQDEGVDLAPDGWGRYITTDTEVLWSLEWDRGTEPHRRLAAKAKGYVSHFAGRTSAESNHVLFVMPSAAREENVRTAIGRVSSPGQRWVTFWTTHLELLDTEGPLGRVWQAAGGDPRRRRLVELGGLRRSARPVDACVGRPGWWHLRPGAGEGA